MAERFVLAEQSAAFDRDDSRAAIEALERLETSERELVVMRIWGGLKYEEIAEALAISISTCPSAVRTGTCETTNDIGEAMFDEREPAEPEMTPDLKAIEGRLARLVPSGARVDRDRLMYEAGKAAAQPNRPGYLAKPSWLGARVWQVGTGLMTAASLMLATMLVWQQQAFEVAMEKQKLAPPVVQVARQPSDPGLEEDVRLDFAVANRSALRQASNGYLGIRYAALTRGVNEMETEGRNLDSVDSPNAVEPTQRDLLHELLPSTTNKTHSRT